LSARVRRVTGSAGASSAEPGSNSYFIGGESGPWALIAPLPHGTAPNELLRNAAPGEVRWLLSTAPRTEAAEKALESLRSSWPGAVVLWPSPGESLDMGGATLVARSAPGGTSVPALQFLLPEERTLFTGAMGAAAVQAGGEAEWIAPASGFLLRHGA